MKKLIAGLFAILLLSGCVAKGGDTESAVSSKQESLISSSVANSESMSEESGDSQENINADVNKALDVIKAYQPGTAGASLKCASAAAGVINFTENTKKDKKAITRAAASYYENLSKEEKELFQQQFEAVDKMARDIISGVAGISDLLDSAGVKLPQDSYHMDKYEVFSAAVRSAIA